MIVRFGDKDTYPLSKTLDLSSHADLAHMLPRFELVHQPGRAKDGNLALNARARHEGGLGKVANGVPERAKARQIHLHGQTPFGVVEGAVRDAVFAVAVGPVPQIPGTFAKTRPVIDACGVFCTNVRERTARVFDFGTLAVVMRRVQ